MLLSTFASSGEAQPGRSSRPSGAFSARLEAAAAAAAATETASRLPPPLPRVLPPAQKGPVCAPPPPVRYAAAMSAQAQMRAMLDQLMGTSRDGDTTRQRIKFSDDRVCKSHLLNCCPHDVLSGTRMDLGECLKVHDLALRADYEIASKEQDFFFELDAMDHLQSFIADCDRRTEVAKKRLAETQEEISAEVAAKAERVHELNEEIGKLLAKVEQLGAEGNVEESQKVMDEVEKARAKKREAEEVYRNSMPASSFQQQKLRVCEVCSAYLGLHDNDRRLADHFGGKLHLGFIEIREKLEELKRVVAEKQEKRNQERLKRREEREREEREKLRRSREHRRHRSRSMSRERKRRTRSKSREKRHRHRSRSSSRSRSRSHQRSGHSSRDRSRERSRRRSSKERFRDQDLASRDRDRSSRDRSPRDRDRKDKKRSYESANGRSEDRRSSEEREAGEI
ncbi:putative RNA-binding protein Luc7-like 2 [Galemys pyrenaicus]|uniref:Luc7-like protein n=1 Tax=Galemys pyrenaicus TaxID=202257 RepID=A0A8J6ARS7_GALPY|nr:putative RNA-binding protein Luc7-like 2 [Galemys pyrenaicus]